MIASKGSETEYLGVDPSGDVRNEYVTPLRWVKPGTLALEQSRFSAAAQVT